jgi:hypothetical protein
VIQTIIRHSNTAVTVPVATAARIGSSNAMNCATSDEINCWMPTIDIRLMSSGGGVLEKTSVILVVVVEKTSMILVVVVETPLSGAITSKTTSTGEDSAVNGRAALDNVSSIPPSTYAARTESACSDATTTDVKTTSCANSLRLRSDEVEIDSIVTDDFSIERPSAIDTIYKSFTPSNSLSDIIIVAENENFVIETRMGGGVVEGATVVLGAS